MMPDDSNGESTFEFVDKKVEGISLVDNIPKQDRIPSASGLSSLVSSDMAHVASTASVPYLSAVPPPSALPSFVPPVSTTRTISPAVSMVSAASNVVPQSTVLSAPTPISPSISSQNPVSDTFSKTASTSSSSVSRPTVLSSASSAGKGGPSYVAGPSNFDDDPNGGNGFVNWMRGAVGSGGQILSKVAEKAKNSVDSMITTLDPQMRDFLYSGGSVSVVVASDQENIVHPIRDAFQAVFGKATVVGLPVDISKVAASQPVGFTAGLKAAEEKLAALRTSLKLPSDQPVLAVVNIIVEVGESKWFDTSVLLLNDPLRKVTLEAFTQLTPIPPSIVGMAEEETPAEYPLRWSGLSMAISSLMARNLQASPSEWHQAYMGVPHTELLTTAARMLAGLYKSSIGPIL